MVGVARSLERDWWLTAETGGTELGGYSDAARRTSSCYLDTIG